MIIGSAQINVCIGDKSSNLEKCLHYIELANDCGIDLLVFPECALTGYVFNSYEEAFQVAQEIPGKSINSLEEHCRKHKVSTIVGLLEKENRRLYNTAVFIGQDGFVGKYRKTHSLCLGVDRYITKGDSLPVFSFYKHKIGILICYDIRFPEPARILALNGAQIILAPANLPRNAEPYGEFLNQARACENKVFIVSANRVGEERGVRFLGRSQIIHPSGKILVEADGTKEEIIKTNIDVTEANRKHIINKPGEYEMDIFGDRRPEIYEAISSRKIIR